MSTNLTTEDLDRIEQAAKGADSPGRWVVAIAEYCNHPGPVVVSEENKRQVCGGDYDGYTTLILPNDARHVATADPATVLALVDEVRRLRSLADDLEAVERAARAIWFSQELGRHEAYGDDFVPWEKARSEAQDACSGLALRALRTALNTDH